MTSTSVETGHVEKVKRLFEYFGKGDVESIVDLCSKEVDWLHGGNPAILPYCQHYYGKKGVAEFFEAVARSIEPTSVVPSNFREVGDTVYHDFHVSARVIPTGKHYAVDVTYSWRFDSHGKIDQYRSTGDFSAAEAAFL